MRKPEVQIGNSRLHVREAVSGKNKRLGHPLEVQVLRCTQDDSEGLSRTPTNSLSTTC